MSMQEEYSRLIANLSDYNDPSRSGLIKSVSATKTALSGIENRVLSDQVINAVDSFLSVVRALNDLLEDIATKPDSTILPAGANSGQDVSSQPELIIDTEMED